MGDDAFKLPDDGSYPWFNADYAYAGWVPNVSGHLSFNLIDPLSKEPIYNHQFDLASPRTVALHRRRLAKDYPFYDKLVKWFRRSAVQDYVVLAETGRVETPFFSENTVAETDDANGVMVGVVAVLPSEGNSETNGLRKAILAHIDHEIVQATLKKIEGNGDPERRLAQELLISLKNAQAVIACHLMHFALFRTGELRIWFDLNEFLGRDIDQEQPDDNERQAAEKLAKQVYYCLKDILHAHYHHDPHSDQMLPLSFTTTQCSPQDHEKSENEWRYATVRGMARTVVELRHGRSIRGHQQAKGIIAYAQTFQGVLARCIRPITIRQSHRENGSFVPYDFANLIMSLDATDASAQSAINARLQLFAILIGILLSGIALWAGAVQIQEPLCKSLGDAVTCPKMGSGPIVSLVNLVVANPTAFLIVLFTAGLVFFMIGFNGSNALPSVERGIRWLRRLAEAVGAQASRWTRNSDWLGWAISLAFLGGLSVLAGYLAYRVAPKTPVPPVSQQNDGWRGPWATLYPLVGQRIDQSGLLVRSVITPELRSLLGDDYPAFLKLMAPESKLVRDGSLLVLISAAAPGDDAGFLIIDPKKMRLEAGLRRDGLLSLHRTVGELMQRPAAVRSFLGTGGKSDTGAVAIESSTCDIKTGGTDGRTLHLSGSFKAASFCAYSLELHSGQTVSFDRRQANGLDVLVGNASESPSIGEAFTANKEGTQVVRVIWKGWSPKGPARLKPRDFYVRLTVH
jgi:hypothetical protein